MGRVSEAYLVAQEQGYYDLNGDVCINCIHDNDLQILHSENSNTGNCDFCQASDCSVAPATVIQQRIMEPLGEEYADIRVIDLTSLPPVPGFWSDADRRTRAAVQFLHSMADDMSKLVERNSNVDLDYAPTQIISEYLTKVKYETANRFEENPKRVHGIVFRSSKTNRQNYALNFFNREDKSLGDVQNDFLELLAVKHKTLSPG